MISVIIPAHCEQENLEKLLPHIAALKSNGPIEVLVSLSAKTKDNYRQSHHFNGVRFIHCPETGRAFQMNCAAKQAKGDVLVFLHADVMPPPSFFFDIQSSIHQGYEAGFFSYQFDSDNYFLSINAKLTSRDGFFTGGGDQCLFIQRKNFFEIGAFNEAQLLMEDFEFFRRMKKKGTHYKILPSKLTVSARKYRNNSYLRVNLSNLLLITLFKLGCSPTRLKGLHQKLLNPC